MCFKIRKGNLHGFSVTSKMLQSRGLKIVSFLLFVSPRSASPRQPVEFLLLLYACYNVRLSINTSQRHTIVVPIFSKKKCRRLTLYSHIRLVKAAKAKYFQECRHAFLKGTCIWGCQCGGRKIPALQA